MRARPRHDGGPTREARHGQRSTRILSLAKLAGLALWAALAVGLDRYGQREAVGAYDAIVVAGCRVLPDGHPSPALQNRTRQAVNLWRAGPAPTLVFTGGVGRYPPSEARAARRSRSPWASPPT